MTIREFNNIRGWISIISAGVVLGLILGFLTLNYIDENILFRHLIMTSILGGLLGIMIALFTNRKSPLEKSWNPLFRSQDLDSFYRKDENAKPDQKLIDLFSKFKDNELITILWFRFYELTDLTSNKLIEEITKRSITETQIDDFYNAKRFYKNIKPNQCPCCNNKDYLIKNQNRITNCLVCGFNLKIDNPRSISNRIRWSIGIFSNTRLSLKDLKENIKNEN